MGVSVLASGGPGGPGDPASLGGTGPVVVGTKPGPSGGSLTAVTLLAMIADAAARQPEPKVSDSEFVYIRSQVAFEVDSITNGHETVTMDKPHERQVWLPVASVCAPGLLIERGQRTPLGISAQGTQCGGGVNDPTYRFLQSLPTDPRTLLNFIYDKTRGEGQAQGRDGEAFITIGDMMREAIVPPKTAAALYRAAALIPGVRLGGHATNAVGRPGIAVSSGTSSGSSTRSATSSLASVTDPWASRRSCSTHSSPG